MKRIYVDVVADLFHVGHINLFKRAREFGDYLIVGVHSDKEVEKYKRRPTIPEQQRYAMIKYCRLVDELVEDAPLTITEEFICENDIHTIVHGDDFKEDNEQHEVPNNMGIMRYVPYTSGVSTTEIIRKILQTRPSG